MSFIKNAATSLISIIVTLLILEILVRILSPQDLRLNVSQWDEYVGFVNIPNIEGVTTTKDYRMKVKINSKGLRDREFDYNKKLDTYRIGVFGDSFTYGEGVQNDETYPKLLENLINADPQLNSLGKQIEVLNFGIGKTGTSQQYAFYQKEGKKYHLDLVIIGFLAGNDFTDNLSGVFTLNNEKLVHNSAAYSSVRKLQSLVYYFPFYRWLAANSQLTNFVRLKATQLDDQWRTERNAKLNAISSSELETQRFEVEITRQLLTEFRRELALDGVKLILVSLPAMNQKPLEDYSKNAPPPDAVVLYDRLERLLDRDLERLDLTPYFAKLPIKPYYYPEDGHMTPLGLQLVALRIFQFLRPRLITEFGP